MQHQSCCSIGVSKHSYETARDRARTPPKPRLRDSGSRFRVPGYEFRVSGIGFQVLDYGFLVSGFGFQLSAFELRVPGFGFRVLGSRFRVPGDGFQFWVSVLGFSFGFQGTSSPKSVELRLTASALSVRCCTPLHCDHTHREREREGERKRERERRRERERERGREKWERA